MPLLDGAPPASGNRACCHGYIERAEPDDDIDYTLLALLLLEEHGAGLRTEDVARAWLRLLPAGATWTAERAAYRTLLERMAEQFVNGEAPGFDLGECSDNEYNDWIGAQIRADLHGWVCPGRPALAAELARRDASLSHRGDGVHAAAFIAALAAALPASADLDTALDMAAAEIPAHTGAAEGVKFGRSIAGAADAVTRLHLHYRELTPLHAPSAWCTGPTRRKARRRHRSSWHSTLTIRQRRWQVWRAYRTLAPVAVIAVDTSVARRCHHAQGRQPGGDKMATVLHSDWPTLAMQLADMTTAQTNTGLMSCD